MKRLPKKSPPPTSQAADEADPDRDDLEKRLAELQAERDKYKSAADSAHQTKQLLIEAQSRVSHARASFEEADAARKAAKAAVDEAIAEELALVTRWTCGEQLLPFPQEPAAESPETSAPLEDPAASRPIGVLGQKSIKALIGKEEADRLKSIGEPVGLTDKELDLLEGIGLDTIGKLETRMRKDELWHRDISGFGETKINKLLNTLRVYRQHHPMPTETTPADQPSETPQTAPEEPQTADWEQACYHLREIVSAAQTLQENGPGDCIEEMGSVIGDAINLELAINASKELLPEQKEQIAKLAAAVESWKRPAPGGTP